MSRSESKRHRAKQKRLCKQAEHFPSLDPTNDPNFYDEEFQHRQGRKNLKELSAMNEVQGQMISQIYDKDVVFVTGPAGTGKTYISAAIAADMFQAQKIKRIIITRPMVGCGEEMGHLPGDIDEKYGPWVQPVIDVLDERLGKSYVKNLLRNKSIESIPLQFMRGMSLKNSFIICDEAQNISPDQMKMLLTRIGEGSKMVIDGDMRQSDLRDGRGIMQKNGLDDAVFRLRKIPEIGHIQFDREDIVRHGITRKILEAYDG